MIRSAIASCRRLSLILPNSRRIARRQTPARLRVGRSIRSAGRRGAWGCPLIADAFSHRPERRRPGQSVGRGSQAATSALADQLKGDADDTEHAEELDRPAEGRQEECSRYSDATGDAHRDRGGAAVGVPDRRHELARSARIDEEEDRPCQAHDEAAGADDHDHVRRDADNVRRRSAEHRLERIPDEIEPPRRDRDRDRPDEDPHGRWDDTPLVARRTRPRQYDFAGSREVAACRKAPSSSSAGRRTRFGIG